MSTEQTRRIQRETPRRTGPIRCVATLLAASGKAASSSPLNGSPRHDVSTSSFGTKDRVHDPAPCSLESREVVARAVHNAYKVLDEQIRYGQEAAQRYCSPFNRGSSMKYGENYPNNMVRLWGQMCEAWLDLMGPFAPAGLRAFHHHDWHSDAHAAAHGACGTTAHGDIHVTFAICTEKKKIEVLLKLSANIDLDKVRVGPLCHEKDEQKFITGVKLERSRDGVIGVVMDVEKVEPGKYMGSVIDKTCFVPCGVVGVVVTTKE
jgi:hypothetical protein